MTWTLQAAEAVHTRYELKLSLFGTVGEASVKIATDADAYVIVVEAEATGLAARISNNEKDRFISRGHIHEGQFISDLFEFSQQNGKVSETNIYLFDHKAKTVTRFQDKNETITERYFSTQKMGFVEEKRRKVTRKSEQLPFYSAFDALSLTLNLRHLVENAPQVVQPVGLAKGDRHMVVTRPKTEDLPDIFDDFHQQTIRTVVGLDATELKSNDVYGLYLGFDAEGGIEEAITKETYFVIGYGRIEKMWRRSIDPSPFFH